MHSTLRDATTPYTKRYDRYVFFTVNGTHYIFDIFEYKALPISEEVKKLLKSEKFKNIDDEIFEELVYKNILI